MANINEVDDREFQEKMKQFLDKGLLDALEKGLDKACLIAEAEAKKKAPVSTGELRNSITHKVIKEEACGLIGTNVEYAPYVELGTGIYAKDGNGRKDTWSYQDEKGNWHQTQGMKPHPFLRPAVEEKKSEILNAFEGLV